MNKNAFSEFQNRSRVVSKSRTGIPCQSHKRSKRKFICNRFCIKAGAWSSIFEKVGRYAYSDWKRPAYLKATLKFVEKRYFKSLAHIQKNFDTQQREQSRRNNLTTRQCLSFVPCLCTYLLLLLCCLAKHKA